MKDYKLSTGDEQGRFVELPAADVNWNEGMTSLVRTGYFGFLSPEIGHDPKDPEEVQKCRGRWIRS